MNTLAEVLQAVAERTRFRAVATVAAPTGAITGHELQVHADHEWRHVVDGVEQAGGGCWLQACPPWLVEMIRTWDAIALLRVDHVSHRLGGVVLIEGRPLQPDTSPVGGTEAFDLSLARAADRISLQLDGHRGAITNAEVVRQDGTYRYQLSVEASG